MRLRPPFLKIILLIGITAWLIACGGGGGGGDDDGGSDPGTSTDCVLGTSAIGDCKI